MPIPMIAGGTIGPSRFVKLSTTADNTVLVAGSNDPIFGISQKGTRTAPYPGLQDNNAALTGEDIMIYQVGETAVIELGGTVAAGDYLESGGSTGTAVTSSVDGHNYGAKTPQAGVSGQLIEVQVVLGMRGA